MAELNTHKWTGHPSSICTCGWSPAGIGWPSLYEAWRRHADDPQLVLDHE